MTVVQQRCPCREDIFLLLKNNRIFDQWWLRAIDLNTCRGFFAPFSVVATAYTCGTVKLIARVTGKRITSSGRRRPLWPFACMLGIGSIGAQVISEKQANHKLLFLFESWKNGPKRNKFCVRNVK